MRSRFWRKAHPGAFTLVELLIVVIILAILAVIAIPKLRDSSRRSFEASLRAQLRILRDGVDRYYNDIGSYPATLDDLTVAVAGGSITLPGGGAANGAISAGTTSGSGGTGSSSSTTTTTGTSTTGTTGSIQGYSSSNHDVYVMPPAVPSQFTGWISYTVTGGKGRVYCPNTGTALDGTAYSTW